LSITTTTGDTAQTYTFEVHVVYDLPLLTAYLQQIYPDASIELSQMREHVVLKGQARSVEQIAQIESTLNSYIASVLGNTSAGNSNRSPGSALKYGTPEQQAGAPDNYIQESGSQNTTPPP